MWGTDLIPVSSISKWILYVLVSYVKITSEHEIGLRELGFCLSLLMELECNDVFSFTVD